MGKLGMIRWLGSARRSLSQVRAQPRAAASLACRSGRFEPRKIRSSRLGTPAWLGLGLGLWLVGCRCQPEPPPELTREDCFRACAAGARCAEPDPAGCASRCQALLGPSRQARASAELRALLKCVEDHPCGGAFRREDEGCASARRVLDERLAHCQPGALTARRVDGGDLLEESLGCSDVESCQPVSDGGALGGPCQTASTCNAVCCGICDGDRTLRVRACISGRCAPEAVACPLAVAGTRCPMK